MLVVIYTLADPETGEVRYVGKTNNERKRMGDHIIDKPKTHKGYWIRSLLARGLVPKMERLEEFPNSDDCDWQEAERFWISYLRFIGCNLCNLETGGMGGKRSSPETREKMSRATKGIKRGPHPEEHKQKIGDAHRGKKHHPDWCANNGAAHKGMKHSEETKKAIAKKMSERVLTPEHKSKIGAAHKGKVPPPGSHCHQKGWTHTAEAKAKMSAANLGRKLPPRSPEYLANLRAAMAKYAATKRATSTLAPAS
jgi:hypothetical protein